MKLSAALLLAVLVVGCGGSTKAGSITGAVLSDGKVVAIVKMDDGKEVRAVLPSSQGVPTKLVGGQRVEVEPVPGSTLWRVVRAIDEAKGRAASGKPFDVAVTSNTRQQQWTPSEGGSGLVLVRGVASKFIDGTMSGFEAEAGYDIAVVSVDVTLNATDTGVSVDKVVALDAAGKEYLNLVDPLPLGLLGKEHRQFGFAVPTGTALVTLRLSNGYTVALAGK